MPIYAYRCEACGHDHEALQKVTDPALVDCPACGAASLKKQVTAAAFRLKGGGWYETDFKSDGKRNLAGDGDDSAKPDAKGAATDKDAGAKTETPKTASPAAGTADGKSTVSESKSSTETSGDSGKSGAPASKAASPKTASKTD